MTDDKLIHAYNEAMRNYEVAKGGSGCRVEAFTNFLVAEKVLTARIGCFDQNLARYRERYSP
jgi:hypothetical protein